MFLVLNVTHYLYPTRAQERGRRYAFCPTAKYNNIRP